MNFNERERQKQLLQHQQQRLQHLHQHQQEMLSIIAGNPSPLPPEVTSSPSTSGYTRCGKSSFPAHIIFHRSLGLSILFASLISIITIACKRCDRAVIYEFESRDVLTAQSNADSEVVANFVGSYYVLLRILHVGIFFGAIHILVLGSFDLVPKHDTDYRFAFHFISVFIIFIVSGISIYSTYIAFTSPCEALEECCSVVNSPGLLSGGERPALTAVSVQDIQMLQVMALDILSAGSLILVGIVYFRDVRRIATDCGYLNRVHNEGYIIRQF